MRLRPPAGAEPRRSGIFDPMPFRLRFALVFLPALAAAPPQPPQSPLSTIVREVQSEVRPGEAMDHMLRIYATDRWFTFPKFEETAEYVKQSLSAAGLSQVEIVHPPADGVTRYGFWTMPLAWDVKQATLEIVDPAVPAEMRVLCDYRKVPVSLGMWSGPTPPDGITAEVVELRTLSPAEIEKADLKGKMVMVRQEAYARKLPLIKKGAIAVINAFSENPTLRDGHWWANYWGDSGWGYTKQSTPLPSFSITPRQADYISDLLARGEKVRLKAVAETRYYPGAYPYATGVLKGTGSDEEVLELGHTTEIGANDNATGVAAMLEAISTLNRLVESGKLKRPRRSIRILAMPEVYGTMHYVASNPERIRRTVAAICLATPAGRYDMAGTEYTFMLNPDVARSYTDALILRIAEAYFGSLPEPRPWHSMMNRPGTDTYLSDPTIGIPTVLPEGGAGVNTHHNTYDTPNTVDPRSLRDVSAVAAAYLYYLASAGEADVPWLGAITTDRAYENILRASAPGLDRIASANGADELRRALYDAEERIAYSADRDEAAVLSTLRLAAPDHRNSLRASLTPTIESLRNFVRAQTGRVAEAAKSRAAQLNVAGAIEPVAPAKDEQLAGAERIVVKRKGIGTITMDDITTDQWEGFPSAAWDGMLQTALNWCDGKRTLAEVIRRTRLEHGTTGFDFVGYFRLLARHGYVDLTDSR